MMSDSDEWINLTGGNAHNTTESDMLTGSTADEGDCIGERAINRDTTPYPDNEDRMITASPAPPNATFDLEKLHIPLTYSTLLALTRHTSRPVVDLNIEAQVRQLDAFLAGDVTEDGVATHWSAISGSDSPGRLQRYKDLCNDLVPNLTAAIKKQSQINLNTQPKNRVNGDKNPEHRDFCHLFLSPRLVRIYGDWVEKSSKEGINPDIDPWTNVVRFGKVIQLFQSICGLQYDFKNWQHAPPKPVFHQTPRLDVEEFMRVMHNHSQIRVYHNVVTPLGRSFSQLDVIPETTVKYTERQLANMWRDKTRPKYLIPDPATVTVPRRRRGVPWVNADGLGKVWTREEWSWSPNFKFMVFDKATNAYIHDHLVDLNLLDQIDLNDETWVSKYRKKICQWCGRATGEATKVRDHWADRERAVVYEFANAWIKKNGIDNFVPRLWKCEKNDLQTALVNKTGHARSVESVSAWARKQMTGKPNEPLGIIYIKGQRLAARIDAGEDISDEERYPDEAIDVLGFLANAHPKDPSKHGKYGKKRKHNSEDEYSDGEDIFSDPRNFNVHGGSDDNAGLAMQDGDDNSDDDQLPPRSPSQSNKRRKLACEDENRRITNYKDEQDALFVMTKPVTRAEL